MDFKELIVYKKAFMLAMEVYEFSKMKQLKLANC